MKFDGFAKLAFVVLASLALIVLALHFTAQPWSVEAQTSAKYGYLVPGAGSSHPDGGTNFYDMGNGNVWDCYQGQCKVVEHYPLEQTLASGE